MGKLIGRTTIELKDIATGKKEIIEHKNTVTTFANNFLKHWAILGTKQANGTSDGSLQQVCLPLATKMFGGVRLYDDDVDTIEYPRRDVAKLVGYAAQVRSDGNDNMRGDLNTEESGAITNGYKFVWDFPTNVANGTIKSICLTHDVGGFHGNKLSPYNMLVGGNTITTNETTSNYRGLSLNMNTPNGGATSLFVSAGTMQACAIELKWNADDNLELYFATLPDKDTLRISKKTYYFGKLPLTASVFPSSKTETVADIDISSIAGFTGNSYIPEVFNGEDGYYYVVFGTINGNSTYKFCRINTTSWTIAQLGVSASANAIYNNNYYYYSDGYTRSGSSRWVTTASNFYILYNSKLYKVSKTNYAISEVAIDSGYTNELYMYKFCGNIVLKGRYIFNVDSENITDAGVMPVDLPSGYSTGVQGAGNLLTAEGVMANFTTCNFLAGNPKWYGVVACNPMYHTTINVLDEAVVKTAGKTMKITYTLTEA